MALIGIGVLPNDDLAADAGLETANGIIVDAFTRTSDERIFAIGDCTRHPNPVYGQIRLESVHNAIEQGKTAAAAITGKALEYNQPPWFWSDQYDVKLQSVGLGAGGASEEVLRGDPNAKQFSVFYFQGGELRAVDSINSARDHMLSRQLLAARTKVSADALRDQTKPLQELLGS